MYQVGAALPTAFRETAEGGLAATPTGRRLAQEILEKIDNSVNQKDHNGPFSYCFVNVSFSKVVSLASISVKVRVGPFKV